VCYLLGVVIYLTGDIMGTTAVAVKWRLRVLLAQAQLKDSGKTITALAEAVGVTRQQASAWANSEEVPTLRDASAKLSAICEFLGCSVSDLIADD
jgi:DNA-binding Xre family transcriptional regulator